MDIGFDHEITYTTEKDVPVTTIVESLLANERLVHFAASVLADCIQGFSIQSVSVRVAQISNSSPLREILAVTLVATFQNDLEKEIPHLIQQVTGVAVPNDYKTLVTVLVMIGAIYGVSTLFSRIFPDKEPLELKKELDRHIEYATKQLGISSGELKRRVENNQQKRCHFQKTIARII